MKLPALSFLATLLVFLPAVRAQDGRPGAVPELPAAAQAPALPGESTVFSVRVLPDGDTAVDNVSLLRAEIVLRKRLNPKGTIEVTVKGTAADILEIGLPSLPEKEIARMRAIIERPGKLDFRLMSPRARETFSPLDAAEEPGYVKLPYLDTKPGDANAGERPDGEVANLPRVFVKNAAEISGKDISSASVRSERDKTLTSIDVQLTVNAGLRMRKLTTENLGKPLAVILDGVVISAPNINAPFGQAFQITGRFTPEEAGVLASALEAPLANPLHVEKVRQEKSPAGAP